MKPCVRLPCYHWSQTYIFPSLLSSPLISPLSLFGAHTVWRRMMNTRLSKAHMLGVLFLMPDLLTYTHTHNHYATARVWCSLNKWTTVQLYQHPAVRPTSRLKNSCITTSNFKTEIGCLCVLSHLLCFQICDTPLLSYIFYLLSITSFSCSMVLQPCKGYILNDYKPQTWLPDVTRKHVFLVWLYFCAYCCSAKSFQHHGEHFTVTKCVFLHKQVKQKSMLSSCPETASKCWYSCCSVPLAYSPLYWKNKKSIIM